MQLSSEVALFLSFLHFFRQIICLCQIFVVLLHAKCVQMDILYAILMAVGAVLAAVALLSVGVTFRKDKQFRSQHISENKRMRERGIHCAVSQDREAKKVESQKLKVKSI